VSESKGRFLVTWKQAELLVSWWNLVSRWKQVTELFCTTIQDWVTPSNTRRKSQIKVNIQEGQPAIHPAA
jgi:hypothetical protein